MLTQLKKMKLPKELREKERKRKEKEISSINSIKKNHPIHTIQSEGSNKLIPCPSCAHTDMFRAWKAYFERTLAICMNCGALFFADSLEIVDVFSGNRDFWGAEALSRALQYSNLNNSVINFQEIMTEIFNTLVNYDVNSQIQLSIISNENLIFMEYFSNGIIQTDSEFKRFLKYGVMNNFMIVILLKTPINNTSKYGIRAFRIHNQRFDYLSSTDLRHSFSIDSQTGEPINPPQEYIFKEFKK